MTNEPRGDLGGMSRSSTTALGYAGEYTETGFQYLRARYYDPRSAQFLTRHPESITREPCGYVSGNPLNFADALGLSKCEVGANPIAGGASGEYQWGKDDDGRSVHTISGGPGAGAEMHWDYTSTVTKVLGRL